MTPSQKLARARNCFDAYCQAEFSGETTQFRDSVFICDGFYRGRRFRTGQLSGVWFAEEDQLKIHSLEGACVASWDASEMERQLERHRPSTLPMRQAEPEVAAQPIRRAA